MKKKRITYLYERYLSDMATVEELHALKTILRNPEDEELLKEVMDKGWPEENQEGLTDTTPEKADYIFQHIILQPQKKKASKKLWIRIAAAATIVMAIGAGLHFYPLQPDQHHQHLSGHIPIENDPLPGTNKAILTLSDGTKIPLTASNGELIYRASQSLPLKGKENINTISTPIGGQYQVLLSDGTKVWLNAASELKFPVDFTKKKSRSVELTGEGYFEVAKDKSKPFIVKTLKQEVQVLGTHFNINGYTNDGNIKTTLLEGSVKITSQQDVVLKPGEQATFQGGTVKITQVNTEDAIAWKNGYFKFNESLQSIMVKISRWYNVEIHYEPNVDLEQSFSGEISRSRNLSAVLKIMESTGNVHFKMEGRRISVMK